ncbi:MAG: DUF6265 family protein [Fimbriimonadaceae bacterium]
MLAGLLASLVAPMSSPTIDDLRFMQGSWTAERGTGVSEETWMPPSGRTMLGVSRTIREGKTRFTEFLQIEELEGKLKLTICQKLGGSAITLTASKWTGQEVIFEPVDDPNNASVAYRAVKNDLHATVSGVRDSAPYTLEFIFKKKP